MTARWPLPDQVDRPSAVRINLLGGFTVSVDDVVIPDHAWSRRHAAGLVKLLALAPARRLHREQILDALWPELAPAQSSPRLHKAAHYARRALGARPRALVLHGDLVSLLPDDEVVVDVQVFRGRARDALANGSWQEARDALSCYAGPLLPGDLYEEWSAASREEVSALAASLEAVARSFEPSGRWSGRSLRPAAGAALRLVTRPATGPGTGPATGPASRRLFGRRDTGELLRARLERAEEGQGGTLLVVGPPGVGKSAVLDLAAALAARRGWRTGRGQAAAVEGLWPYAPVLEALGDLCRRHPMLLDGLDADDREVLVRAMRGGEVATRQRLFLAAAEAVRLAARTDGLLLAVDDVDEADADSWGLLHYLARTVRGSAAILVLTQRHASEPSFGVAQESLLSRGLAEHVEIGSLSEGATRRLLADAFPGLDEETVGRIWQASGGLPATALRLARDAVRGTPVRRHRALSSVAAGPRVDAMEAAAAG
jgi:hypothetical protein